MPVGAQDNENQNETDEDKATRLAASAAAADNQTPEVTAADNQTPAATAAKADPFAELRGKDLTADQVNTILDRLTAANGEAASNRHKLKEYERQNEDATAKSIRESKETGYTEAEAKYHPILIKNAAKVALTDAGATKGHDSLLRLIDNTAVTVDEDGDVTGLKEEIARMKKEFPELFTGPAPAPTRRSAAAGTRADGGARSNERRLSAAEQHANRALGRD